jgi:hypothetical protein
MTTRVINIKTLEPYDVYIGNLVRFHPERYPQTKWGNPYSKYLKKYGREKVIKMHREYLFDNLGLLTQINELKGKILGCWCKPAKCHGDILAELADKT